MTETNRENDPLSAAKGIAFGLALAIVFWLWLAVFLLAPAVAQAQAPQPPPYAPITIDQKTYEDLRRMLGRVAFDDALQIIVLLETLERAAQQQAAKERGEIKP